MKAYVDVLNKTLWLVLKRGSNNLSNLVMKVEHPIHIGRGRIIVFNLLKRKLISPAYFCQ
jgi:hypothetical protein